jgi:hypothetical protein
MLSWIIILLLAAAVCMLFASYFVEPGTIMVIERRGKFKRLASSGYNCLIPILDNPASILELSTTTTQIITDISIDTLSQINIDITLQYAVDPDLAATAHYQLPDPASVIREQAKSILTRKLIASNNHGRKVISNDLQHTIQSKLSEFLKSNGYKLNSITVNELKYSENPGNMNLNSTSELSKLLEIKPANRDHSWTIRCEAAIWQACFIEHEAMHTVAQDDCPYIQLRTPAHSKQISKPISFSEALAAAKEQGHGIMLYAGDDQMPAWALTFGDILQLTEQQKLPAKMGIDHRGFEALGSEQMIPMGPIDDTTMPAQILHIAKEFLKNIGIKHPKAMQTTKIGGDLSMAATFNIFTDSFEDIATFNRVQYQLRWLIPANIEILFAKNEEILTSSFIDLEPAASEV